MAKEYVVVHPVRHDGKPYNRGERIAASKLTEEETVRLLAHGAITEPSGAVVVVEGAAPAVFSESTLGKLNLEELTAYAGTHGITPTGTTKAEILSEISQSLQAGADLRAAEGLAESQGR